MPLYNTFLALHSLLSDNAIIQCQICNNATSASFEEFTKWNQNPNGQPEIDLHKWHWPDNANCAFTKCVILHEYCMIASKIAIFTVVTRSYLTPVCQWYYLQVQKIANLALFEGCQLCVLCIPKGNTRHNWHCINLSKYAIFTQDTRHYLIPVCHRYYLRGYADCISGIVRGMPIVQSA